MIEANSAIRRLLDGGEIVLSPNSDRTGVTGDVRFVDLGDHILELAGWKRQPKVFNSAQIACAICFKLRA